VSGQHICSQATCQVGRPFLVRGEERLAGVEARHDWCAAGIEPDLDDVTPSERAALAQGWTRIARMEHASIAAFARFTMQLMALAAPAELVRAAQTAMGDETEHALMAFGLASAYAGMPVGPSALSIDGALDGCDVTGFVAMLLREGCIGETVAAIEAREGADRAADPRVRAVLSTIARDELRHAELAWRTLAWLVSEGLVDDGQRLGEEFARAASEGQAPRADGEDLSKHGLVTEARRAQLRRSALQTLIEPLLRHVSVARGMAHHPSPVAGMGPREQNHQLG
jgi:hypothetical protein